MYMRVSGTIVLKHPESPDFTFSSILEELHNSTGAYL